MASPQIEDGYTQIANELLEAISLCKLSGSEFQVLWVIIRKTYGYQKISDSISLSQFCLATGINKQNVCRALSILIKKNMVIKSDKALITKYRIQKDYTIWVPLSNLIRLSNLIKPVINSDKDSVINSETYKRNKNTKETIYPPLFEQFWESYPRKLEKKDCHTTWKKLNPEDKAKVIVAARNYTTAMKTEGREIQHIKHPKSFLNKDRWKDYLTTSDPVDEDESYLKKQHASSGPRRF